MKPNVSFVTGLPFFIKNKLIDIKAENGAVCVFDLEENLYSEISNVVCFLQIMKTEKRTLVLNKIPNNKKERAFCEDLISNCLPENQIYFLDYDQKIKFSKNGHPEHEFATNIVENGNGEWIILETDFSEKDILQNVNWVKKEFSKNKIEISNNASEILLEMTGNKKELIFSEISKLSDLGLGSINESLILDYVAKLTKDEVLFKFSAALDLGVESGLKMLERFLNNDVHPNILTEMLLKRARWNLFIADLCLNGKNYYEIKDKITNRHLKWTKMDDLEKSKNHFTKKFGKTKINNLEKYNTGETIASPYIADLIAKSYFNKYVDGKSEKTANLEDCLNNYQQIFYLSTLIRFNYDLHRVYLCHMVRLLCKR